MHTQHFVELFFLFFSIIFTLIFLVVVSPENIIFMVFYNQLKSKKSIKHRMANKIIQKLSFLFFRSTLRTNFMTVNNMRLVEFFRFYLIFVPFAIR